MTKTTQNRAPIGGVIGVNGSFYEGGKFIPSTDRAKRKGSRPRKASKVETAPYEWQLSREDEGLSSIYSRVGHLCDKSVTRIAVSDTALDYSQVSAAQVETYLHLYGQGYRFIAEVSPYRPVLDGAGEYIIE